MNLPGAPAGAIAVPRRRGWGMVAATMLATLIGLPCLFAFESLASGAAAWQLPPTRPEISVGAGPMAARPGSDGDSPDSPASPSAPDEREPEHAGQARAGSQAAAPVDPASASAAVVRERSSQPLTRVDPAAALSAHADQSPSRRQVRAQARRERSARSRAYFSRPLPASARHLDHGVIEVEASTGMPFVYQLSLGLGLLDHLTLGASVHWLTGQPWPQVAPWASVAFFRTRRFELGWLYRAMLHAPPPDDEARAESERKAQLAYFQRRAHYLLGTASFTASVVSVGFDAGFVHMRVPIDTEFEPDPHLFERKNFIAGGLHVRVGTRRWGLSASVLMPEPTIELGVDLRLGLFELRERGGWRATR